MVRHDDLVAIFNSVHRVLQAEKALKAEGAEFLLIPVPRQLTSDCGLAIRFSAKERKRIEGVLEKERIRPAEIYRREQDRYSRVGP